MILHVFVVRCQYLKVPINGVLLLENILIFCRDKKSDRTSEVVLTINDGRMGGFTVYKYAPPP